MHHPHKRDQELGWPEIQQQLAARCETAAGARAAAELGALPAERIEPMLALVAEARALRDASQPLPLGGIFELDQALERLRKEGTLAAATLVRVASTLRSTDRLRRFVVDRRAQAPGLARTADALTELPHVWQPIDDAFDPSGELADHASPELGRLRRQARELHEKAIAKMRRLLEAPGLAPHLQDRFYTQREERYVLPIRASSGAAVDGIVLGSSHSGATLFVEPRQVVELNNRLKVAELEVTREELRILAQLSALVQQELPAIERNLALTTELDLVDARARLASAMGAHRPTIADDGAVALRGVRHPLMALAGSAVVANDLLLAPRQTLVVSGPNAGGKTVSLKTLGLCALMLRAGLHLPAEPDSCMPLYDDVLTDIGDDQSIENSLSTFTAHIGYLLDFGVRARPGTLVLLDEIATATDPGEGESLALALLEHFADSGAQIVVTTHYERLKALALDDQRFVNASVGFDLETLAPTYRLHLGTPGSSCALSVARRVGLPEAIARRAEALQRREELDLAQLLTDLAGKQTALDEQLAAARSAEATARQRQTQLEQGLEELRREGKRRVREAHAEALEQLKRARQELERVRAQLRQAPDKERAKQADRQVSAAAALIAAHEPRPPEQGVPVAPEQLHDGTIVVGTELYVPRLGGAARVLEIDARGTLSVQAGPLRAQVTRDEVRLLSGGERRQARRRDDAAARAEGPVSRRDLSIFDLDNPPVRAPDLTFDARGMRVESALDEVDRFVDQGLLQDRDVLFVLHGHGSGALRSALRAHLRQANAVRAIRPGRPEEGGDAVTVLWLR